MSTIKKQIEDMVDASGYTWSEEMIEKVYLKVLYHLAKKLTDYDISFIEKLDQEEGSGEKIESYIKEKGIDLEEVANKEIAFAKASLH